MQWSNKCSMYNMAEHNKSSIQCNDQRWWRHGNSIQLIHFGSPAPTSTTAPTSTISNSSNVLAAPSSPPAENLNQCFAIPGCTPQCRRAVPRYGCKPHQLQVAIWLQAALIHATRTSDKTMSMDRKSYKHIHIEQPLPK